MDRAIRVAGQPHVGVSRTSLEHVSTHMPCIALYVPKPYLRTELKNGELQHVFPGLPAPAGSSSCNAISPEGSSAARLVAVSRELRPPLAEVWFRSRLSTILPDAHHLRAVHIL